MNIIKREGQLLVDSREVAEMIGKRHKDLLENIRGYINHLTSGKFRPSDFFLESTYEDAKGELRPCYLLTRKGCDMVANKMTGEKGVLFTAAYVTKFEEMEKQQPKVLSEREQLVASMKLTIETSEQVEQLTSKVEEIETKVNERITLDHGQQTALHHQIKVRVESIFSDYEEQYTKNKLYSQLHSHLRRAFQAPKYIFVKSKDFEDAMQWVKVWRPMI
ncbi:Rha family transcriptional regulator [Alkalihalobacterium alkalinitrilicum]|uniref:Rha family transcriptional regulator n=1 Tax=Alkalihalobacterium alkalinitrilicum TaxID=427920 RepID=UPI000995B241|nr:Rha family transcriptional regulator [Alkalihalobacterium alkalinitrilicum]